MGVSPALPAILWSSDIEKMSISNPEEKSQKWENVKIGDREKGNKRQCTQVRKLDPTASWSHSHSYPWRQLFFLKLKGVGFCYLPNSKRGIVGHRAQALYFIDKETNKAHIG